MQTKSQLLAELAADIEKNDVCPELRAQAIQLVLGDGNPDADIVFIGEAPGKKEDELGLPFVGASGRFLDLMLDAAGMDRDDVYITNIVKYRPPGNRDPTPQEKAAFLPYLIQQLQIIQPRVVITLGRHSMACFLPDAKIADAHGKTYETEYGWGLVPLYHPAAALYNGSRRQELIDDFIKATAVQSSAILSEMTDTLPSHIEDVTSEDMRAVMGLVYEAGEILKKYHGTNLQVDYKVDQFDPVTRADKEADDLLRDGLSQLFPDDALLSEENPLLPDSYEGRVWMIDPLDGTKGYVAGDDTASVMVGRLDAAVPSFGIVYLPFRGEWYVGELGRGSYHVTNSGSVRLKTSGRTGISGARLVNRIAVEGDLRPMEQLIEQLPLGPGIREGSAGVKIGLIANNLADLNIHTHLKAGKWDTLAAQVILQEAGGAMANIDGEPLDYTKPDSKWDRYFVAASSEQLLRDVIAELLRMNQAEHIF